MPELYRLLTRKIPVKGFRCLVLRDPTPNAANEPEPIGPDMPVPDPNPEYKGNPVVEAHKLRWLYGLDEAGEAVEMRLLSVGVSKLTRVALNTVAVAEGLSYGFTDSEFVLDGQQVGLKLFDSVRKLWTDSGLVASSAELFELQNEVVSMVDAFCCSQRVKYQTVETSETVVETTDPIGPASLIQLYLDDRPLRDVAESDVDSAGRMGSLALAALSGYVFDVEMNTPEELGGGPAPAVSFSGTEDKAILTVINPAQSAKPAAELPLVIDQESEGMYVRVDWRASTVNGGMLGNWRQFDETGWRPTDPEARVALNDLSDHTMVVKRSIGPAPVFDLALARSPLLVGIAQTGATGPANDEVSRLPKYVFVDRLTPEQFEGQLLHYAIEVRDVVDNLIARGEASIRRLRLDPPPMPVDAKATIVLANDPAKHSLLISVELPRDPKETNVEPVVWFQTRPLDSCGFFGTDDDMALEEGLRQADLNFEEGADTTEPRDWEGHPVSRYLRGAYDRHGLAELTGQLQFSPLDEEERKSAGLGTENGVVLRASLSPDNWPCRENLEGARLYVALRRKSVSGESASKERSIESVLRPCDHYIQAGDGEAQRIFQIERIPSAPNGRDFFERDRIALHYVHYDNNAIAALDPDPNDHQWDPAKSDQEPFRIQVRFPVLSVGPLKPGGFRVWIRDVVSNDKPPFELVRVFEALPPQVYRYRPYGIDSAKQLVARNQALGLPNPISFDEDVGLSTARVRGFFDALETQVRQLAGAPRLVRSAIVAIADEEIKGGEFSVPNLNQDNQAAALLAKLKQTAREHGCCDGNEEHELWLKAVTLDKISELLNEDVKKPFETIKTWTKPMLGHWALISPFLNWAHANGLARDLILPMGAHSVDDLDKLKLLDALSVVASKHSVCFIVFAVQPACWAESGRLLATLRICMIPRKAAADDNAYGKLLQLALQNLLTNGVLHIYQDNDPSDFLLPFDDCGICTVEWPGLQDGWRHQLECMVERLDRYALVRSLQATPGPKSSATPLMSQAAPSEPTEGLDEKHIQRLVVPRRVAAPPPPTIRLVPDLTRVMYRISDSPERIAAAQNLVMRVRGGRITRIVEFDYRLPWLERYRKVLGVELKPDGGHAAKPSETESADTADVAAKDIAWKWSETDEDEVEVLDPLYFVRYRLRVRHRADRIEGAHALDADLPSAQCLPRVESENFQIDRNWSAEKVESSLRLSIQALRLHDLLTEDERNVAKRYALPGSMLNLPDLETQYTLLFEKEESNRLITLAVIKLPGYAGDHSEIKTEAFRAPDMSPMSVNAATMENDGTDWILKTTIGAEIDINELLVLVSRGDIATFIARKGA